MSPITSANLQLQNLQVNEARNPEPGTRNTKTPEEAARSFEKVLVQQFVNVMTEQMFKSNLSGEDGPAWMKSQSDTQRQVLTEVLTDHLVDTGTFNISDIMLTQWQNKGFIPAAEAQEQPTTDSNL